MNYDSSRRGFTLIELMIVIAIIAIIAAIAIPGLIASQRASNERNASSSLKTLSAAEVDFRSNDRDNNKVVDYWVRDVSGLYTLCPIGYTDPLKLIEISLCAADSNPQGTAAAPVISDEVSNSFFAVQSPKAGFWYMALTTDQEGNPYAQTSTGLPPFNTNWFNTVRFGFLAYPESYTAGRSMFYLNEGNTLFKRTLRGNVRPAGGTVPPGTALVASGAIGTSPLDAWPTDSQLKIDYSRLD